MQLKTFERINFLGIDKHEEYIGTSDFKKFIKISKDYYERYSTELKGYWGASENYTVSTSEVNRLI